MVSLDLVLLMLAVGAVAGMPGRLVGLRSCSRCWSPAGARSAMLAFVRPSMVKRLHERPELAARARQLVGKQGLVIETGHGAQPGRVKLSGEVWSARRTTSP